MYEKHPCTNMFIYICKLWCKHGYVYVYVYNYTYIYVYIYVFTYACICTLHYRNSCAVDRHRRNGQHIRSPSQNTLNTHIQHIRIFIYKFIYICIYMYMYIHICIYMNMHTHIHVYIHINIYVYIHSHTHIYLHISIRIHTIYVYMRIYIYTYAYIYIYRYKYTYIYMHLYVHYITGIHAQLTDIDVTGNKLEVLPPQLCALTPLLRRLVVRDNKLASGIFFWCQQITSPSFHPPPA